MPVDTAGRWLLGTSMRALVECVSERAQVADNSTRPQTNFDAPAILRKWPSLQNERRGTDPYLIINGTLDECLQMFMTKAASTRQLYEIHTFPQPPMVSSVLSGEDVVELARLRDFL
jgi:hypothetical protein